MTHLSALAARQPSSLDFPSVIPLEEVDAMNRVILAFCGEVSVYCQEELSGMSFLFMSHGMPGWAMKRIQDCYLQARDLTLISQTPEWMVQSPMAMAYLEFCSWGACHLIPSHSSEVSTPGELLLALVVDRVVDYIQPELMEFRDYCQVRSLLARRAGILEKDFSLSVPEWHAFLCAQVALARRASFRVNGSYLPHSTLPSRFQIRY